MFFNPLMVLSTRFIAPVLVRFLGVAISNTLLRSTIGTLVPFLIELPVGRLLQIAFFRGISGTGSTGLITSPSALPAIRTVLMMIPGVTTNLITQHTNIFNSIVRLIVWLWLLFSSISFGTLVSFGLPLAVNMLGYIGANIALIAPTCSYLISVIKPIIPSFSLSFFVSVRDILISILSYDNIVNTVIPAVQTGGTWWSSIIVVTEFALHWVSPHFSFTDVSTLFAALGSSMVPYIPSILVAPLAMFGQGILCLVFSPFKLAADMLPSLHWALGYLPWSDVVWTYMQTIGSYTIAHIPVASIATWIKAYFGL